MASASSDPASGEMAANMISGMATGMAAGHLADAYGWLDGQVNYERNLGAVAYSEQNYELEGFRQRLAALGEPQRGLRTVHIAGTRGKGSAALALEALLSASGQRLAVYTSPHLREYRERIRLAGAPVAGELFARLLARVAAAGAGGEMETEQAPDPNRPFKTVFESLTALFFLVARERRVDWAVVETGLGGRLDATNVIDPGPVLLTRIGLEHTRLLGDTLEKIAAEKAAILKPGGWGVMAEQEASGAAEGVFRARARETGARLDRATELCPLERLEATPEGLCLTFLFEGRPLALAPPLFGAFQAENLQNALAMLVRLREEGLVPRVPDLALAAALNRLAIPGRMERVCRRPELFVDGGHCPTAAAALARSMRLHFGPADQTGPAGGASTGLIVGMLADKDHDGFFRELAAWPGWGWVWIYGAPSPRAADPAELARAARRYFHNIRVFEKVEQALEALNADADKLGRVVATGSLYGIAGFEDWGSEHGVGIVQTQTAAQTEPGASD